MLGSWDFNHLTFLLPYYRVFGRNSGCGNILHIDVKITLSRVLFILRYSNFRVVLSNITGN